MKNYGDLGGYYLPRPTASTDNNLLDLHNYSYDTQPYSLIVKCKFGKNICNSLEGLKFCSDVRSQTIWIPSPFDVEFGYKF